MKPSQLFHGTMSFTLARLLLGSASFAVSVLFLLLYLSIGQLFSADGIIFSFILWLITIRVTHHFIMHYFGYMIKAGHIAVLSAAVTTGILPSDPLAYGKQKVKERFLEANVYWAVDKLVTGAVRQIQRGIEKLGSVLDFIPGMQQLTNLAAFFVELSLGYIDECCLGYSFYRTDQGAFQSACDGVVLYAQNIKALLKNAALTMLKVVLLMTAITLLVFVLLRFLFLALHWNLLIAFAISCFITWIIKFSFIDSYILCCTMVRYMEFAASSTISYDLYAKLSGISSSFKQLWKKGMSEPRTTGQPAYATATAATVSQGSSESPRTSGSSARYCASCGMQNHPSASYCRRCGRHM